MEILIVMVMVVIGFLLITSKKTKSNEWITPEQVPKVKNEEKKKYEFRKIEKLYTDNEMAFLRELRKGIDEKYDINGKVRLADVIKVKSESRFNWQNGFNRIKAKHLDYVLSEKDTGKIVCCIELDDKSHESEDRIKRDIFLNNALKEARVKIVRFKSKYGYDAEEIKKAINEKINPIEKMKEELNLNENIIKINP